jgi:hypothetical protein
MSLVQISRHRKLAIALTAVSSLVFPLSAQAISIGDQITGSLNVGGVPVNLYIPNNVSFSPAGTEFSIINTSIVNTADFTTTGLVIDTTLLGLPLSTTQTFVSDGFIGSTLTLLSNTFPAAPTYSLTGDTITITTPALSPLNVGTNYQANFQLVSNTATSVPEPLTMIGSVVGVIAAVKMRKNIKDAAK